MILVFDIGGSRIKAAVWDGELRPVGEVAGRRLVYEVDGVGEGAR